MSAGIRFAPSAAGAPSSGLALRPFPRLPVTVLSALVLGALLLVAVPAAAATEPSIPAPEGFVNDRAGIMGEGAAKTEALCRRIEELTTAEVAVLTVRSTRPLDAQAYAQKVFDTWKIGKKGKDNGVLFLVAADDRKMWIATGYGVEGVLPDGKVGEIRDRVVIPWFRQGHYGEGIHQGVAAIGNVLSEGKTPPPERARRKGAPIYILFVPLVFLALILYLFREQIFQTIDDYRSGRLPGYRGGWGGGFAGGGGGWGGGFGGGGFGGFGGGGSGGGGAGGGW